jgi:hypothetical protein
LWFYEQTLNQFKKQHWKHFSFDVLNVDSKYFKRAKGNLQPQTGIPPKSATCIVSSSIII